MYISELKEEVFEEHRVLVPDMASKFFINLERVIYLSQINKEVSVHFVGGDKLTFYTYKGIGHFLDVNPMMGEE